MIARSGFSPISMYIRLLMNLSDMMTIQTSSIIPIIPRASMSGSMSSKVNMALYTEYSVHDMRIYIKTIPIPMEFKDTTSRALLKLGLSPSSIDIYKRSLARLRREKPGKGRRLNQNGLYTLSPPLLKDIAGNKAIFEKWPLGSQRSLLSGIINLLKISKMKDKGELINEYNQILSNVRANETLEAMEDNKTNIHDIKTYDHYIKQAEDKNEKDQPKQEKDVRPLELRELLVTLYKNMPPLRTSELSTLSYNEKDPNYIDLSNKKIVIRNHKSSKVMGHRTIPLNDDLVEHLQNEMDAYPRDRYLFQYPGKDKPIGYVRLSQIIKELFTVSPSELRKAYISTYVPSMTIGERVKTANEMGHTIGTQELSYRTSIE
jgi:integrase